MNDAQEELKRLYWRCRRGTRELDLLLLRFLERDYPGLPATAQALFGSLLEESDPDLYAWFSGQCEPSNPDYLFIIDRVKAASNNER